jgi:hypothetical protein
MKLIQRFLMVVSCLAVCGTVLGQDSHVQHQTFEVAATNDEWTPTSIVVSPGDILVIGAAGQKIVIGAYMGAVTADGTQNGVGALTYKIGVGAGKRIGADGFIRVGDHGELKLRVHDTNYGDNSGAFTVDVILIPANMIPPVPKGE